ncbi:MAG: hypothetical protein ACE5F1_17475 [Planctomycetota bacterium]
MTSILLSGTTSVQGMSSAGMPEGRIELAVCGGGSPGFEPGAQTSSAAGSTPRRHAYPQRSVFVVMSRLAAPPVCMSVR